MRLLILGGTQFLGRALVDATLAAGHVVTLFNRGRTNPELFPELERLRGDRAGDLAALAGRDWDAVVDTSGQRPDDVRRSAELLADHVDRYAFISSMSVYADTSKTGINERGPVATIAPERAREARPQDFGALKALCESAVKAALPERSLIVRPGLIVGPHDPSDRFTYWPHRMARGGEVLAPGHPNRRIQYIDVRDLAEWTLRQVEQGATGTYNAVGPDPEPEMEELLHVCRTVSGAAVRITWASEPFLLSAGLRPWIELPLWVPESNPAFGGFLAFDASKARRAGLCFRPTEETVRSTLEWSASRPEGYEWRAGLTRQREAELLQRLRSDGDG